MARGESSVAATRVALSRKGSSGPGSALKRAFSTLSTSCSCSFTSLPSSGGDSEPDATGPVQKLHRLDSNKSLGDSQRTRKFGCRELCELAHQFGLVGEPDYNSKETRLAQLLERLPARPTNSSRPWTALVFADSASAEVVEAIVAKAAEQLADAAVHVDIVIGRAPRLPEDLDRYCIIINYDVPATGDEYLRRAAVAQEACSYYPAGVPGVVYTMVTTKQLERQSLQEIKHKLRTARRLAKTDPECGGAAKAAELDSALMYLGNDFDDEGGDEEAQAGDDSCDCVHCSGRSAASVSYHSAQPGEPSAPPGPPRVEVARVPLQALENFDGVAPYIAPRLPNHTCTVICLHNMYCHTPWDGYEHLFALPEGMGSVRVVMVLATGCSWHNYPDVGAFAGGVSWMDILDMDSMDKADSLMERLVDHEIKLLKGCSERLVLFGVSQGGGQSMLRYLRSKQRLGGWIGAVCHAPTAPHAPRGSDPLVGPNRTTVNCDRPMRLLAGELDTTFASSLVLRDISRLREVGEYTDVAVTVQEGLTHEGPEDWNALPPELLFLQKHLPAMVSSSTDVASPTMQ